MDIIRERLKNTCASVRERFSLQCSSESIKVLLEPSRESQNPIWNVRLSQGILICPPEFHDEDSFSRAVLAREVLRMFLPRSLEDSRARFDIACEYGRQTLNNEPRGKWTHLWKEASPPQTLTSGLRYRPIVFFSLLRHLSGGSALTELVSRLSQMARYGIALGFEDWAELLIRYTTEYERTLTKTEAYLVDALIQNPQASLELLAQRADISPRWAGAIRRNLLTRGQLLEFELVSYSQIGIRVLQVALFPKSAEIQDCSYLIEDCPFAFSASSLLTGGRGIYATMCVPDNPTNLNHIQRMVDVAQKDDVDVFVFDRHRSGNWLNLNDYNPIDGTWDIDWDSVRLEAQMMQRDSLAVLYPEMRFSERTDPRRLDRLDIRLLSEFERGRKTTRQLQRALGIRMKTIADRLRRLRGSGIIEKSYEIHHIGLVEEAITYIDNIGSGECLAALALRFPRCFIDYDNNERLFMRIRLPRGGSYGLASALRPIQPSPTVHLVGGRLWGRWRLSEWIDEWIPETGRWQPTSKDMHRWYSSMDEGPAPDIT